MKKVKIKLFPRKIKDTGVVGGYSQQGIISLFFRQYSLKWIGVLLFQLQMLSICGRYEVRIPIETDDGCLFDFKQEMEEFFKSVYLDHNTIKRNP